MKRLAWLALGAIALTVLVASAAEQQDRPAGVEEQHWIAISDRFGFVVQEARAEPGGNSSRQILIAPPDVVSAVLMPPTKGYFVVKTPMGWRRVVIAADPAEWVPLHDR